MLISRSAGNSLSGRITSVLTTALHGTQMLQSLRMVHNRLVLLRVSTATVVDQLGLTRTWTQIVANKVDYPGHTID